MSSSGHEALSAEAQYLYRSLFGREPIPQIVARYVRAHDALPIRSDVDIARMIDLRLDPEALEFHLRRRRPENALTQKMRTLLYLVEIEPAHYSDFVRDRGSLLSSLPVLIWAPIRSAIQLWKGARAARRLHAL